ncbi:hypothetical protein Tco_0622274 [Tanacetum coccineum]
MLTWHATWQRWPPFDPTVDWRSTAVDQWLTGGPAMVDRWLTGGQAVVDRRLTGGPSLIATVDRRWPSLTTVGRWSGGVSCDSARTLNKLRGTTQVVTRGYLMINCRSRWRLRGTVHQRGQYEVQNSEGQYEVQNSEGSIRGSGCTRWLANHRLPRGQNDKNSVVIRRVKTKQSLAISYEAS